MSGTPIPTVRPTFSEPSRDDLVHCRGMSLDIARMVAMGISGELVSLLPELVAGISNAGMTRAKVARMSRQDRIATNTEVTGRLLKVASNVRERAGYLAKAMEAAHLHALTGD